MLKLIHYIFEILLGTAIMFFGSLLAIWGSSTFLGMAIIGIGLFVLAFAVKNNPRSNHPTNISGAKRLSLLLICVVVSFILFATGITRESDKTLDTQTSQNITESSSVTIPEETTLKASQLGEYEVQIKEHYKSKGFYDEKLVVVVFTFTNESDNTICFNDAIDVQAFQNGVELNLYIATNIPGQVDVRDSYKELKPGASYDVPIAYILDDTENNVEIELSSQFVFEPITYTITLN